MDDLEAALITEVSRAIANNELTAEMALQKWYELYALRTLPKKIAREAKRQPLAK